MPWGDWDRWAAPVIAALLAADRFVHKRPFVEQELRNLLDRHTERIEDLEARIARMTEKASEQGSRLIEAGEGWHRLNLDLATRLAVVEDILDRRKVARR